jgi:hypothetical protein
MYKDHNRSIDIVGDMFRSPLQGQLYITDDRSHLGPRSLHVYLAFFMYYIAEPNDSSTCDNGTV